MKTHIKQASNEVINYYNQYSVIRHLEDNYNLEVDDYKRVAAKIFDAAMLRRQETDAGELCEAMIIHRS